MAAEDGSNGVWYGDTEGHCPLLSLLHFRNLPNKKASRPRKHEGWWYLLLY